MASLNKVLLIGNLTRDPELRYTPGGLAVCNFTIAINSFYNDSQGQKQKDTCFMRVTVWGKSGEACSQYLAKGRPVFVEGRLKSRNWEAENGEKRSAVDVVADRVQFLGGGPGEGGEGGGGGRGKPSAPRSSAPDMDDMGPPADMGGGPEDDIPF
jgi:single-strand DNA-binding protein